MMNVSYWLDTATRDIRFSLDRRRVRQELEDHIQDRIEAEEARGLSPSQASRAVMEAMGDPKELARELAAVHSPWLGRLWRLSQAALVILALVMSFNLLCSAAFRDELVWRLFPGQELEISIPPEERISAAPEASGPTVIRRTGLWQDMDLGSQGGYRWTVPAAWTRSFFPPAPEEASHRIELVLTGSSWRFWEPWNGWGTILAVEDSTGLRYADRSGGEEYEETEPRFWYNVEGSTLTSRSILLHLEYSPPAEDLDWLELTIGDHVLRIDLKGGTP